MKRIFYCLLLAASFTTVVLTSSKNHGVVFSAENLPNLSMEITSPKQTYSLGEAVPLRISVTNTAKEPFQATNGFNVAQGYLTVWLAGQDGTFREYLGPSWGTKNVTPKPWLLATDAPSYTQATLLWNHKPNTTQLNAVTASRTMVERVATDYAFFEPGIYFIKAVWQPNRAMATSVESSTYQVVIEEPTGDDLAVWQEIKQNGQLGYFLQEGSFLTYKKEEQAKLVQIMKKLADDYPNSWYAPTIRQRLTQYNSRSN